MALQIAVAGCGPAGLSMALFLARAGHRAILFDNMKKPAPLGSGLILQPTGLAVLELLGLRQQAEKRAARLARLFGRARPSDRIVLDVRYDAERYPLTAIGIHRATLFGVLFDAVMAERIPIEIATHIVEYETSALGQARLVDSKGQRHGPFDLIIDALGVRSSLAGASARKSDLAYGALWANVDWVDGFDRGALEQRYQLANQMAGVMPIGLAPGQECLQAAYFWSLRIADYEPWLARGLSAWKEEALALWPQTAPLIAKINHPDQLTFARYRHVTRKRPYDNAIAFVGDSAHATSPQLGQGANMALLDALALSRALERHSSLSEALPAYGRMRQRHVRLYQGLSRIFTPFYQSNSRALPFFRDRLVSPASRLPMAPEFLARLVAGLLVKPIALDKDDPFWECLKSLAPASVLASPARRERDMGSKE